MEPALLTFLKSFSLLTDDELHAIAGILVVRRYKKGTVLLKEGTVSKECYFVLEGCVRQYILIDGIEKTTFFYTERQAIVPFTSHTLQSPSDQYLVCLEDALLIVGDTGGEDEMFERFPKLEQITRRMMEADMGAMQDAMVRFRVLSPEARYLDLLNSRPDLLQRVPQHQLASYLGITPESLSRIRKRIMPLK